MYIIIILIKQYICHIKWNLQKPYTSYCLLSSHKAAFLSQTEIPLSYNVVCPLPDVLPHDPKGRTKLNGGTKNYTDIILFNSTLYKHTHEWRGKLDDRSLAALLSALSVLCFKMGSIFIFHLSFKSIKQVFPTFYEGPCISLQRN